MAVQTGAYPFIHRIPNIEEATEYDFKSVIQTFPIIDNHAHNILREEYANGSPEYPFECITSEAHGHALQGHVHSSLAHIRGMRHLSELYNCSENLQDIKAARYEWVQRDYPGLVKKCLEGTHTLLIDDGLSADIIEPVKWHEHFVPTARRIVRIEAVAAELLESLARQAGLMKPGVDADWPLAQTEAFLLRFNTVFRSQMRAAAKDPNVRGFKSIVCYRSGLDVSVESRNAFRPHQSLTETPLLIEFHTFLQQAVCNHNYRIKQKEFNDFLVVAVCDVLEKLVDTEGESLPIQFHTGLGDADIDLLKANPAYMQSLIAEFPHVDFVILHSSYPYTREAGYLAANFANAYLDIGEVFPMLSRDGEETILREALELTPTSKILWSTDGHFFPESFYLANRQFRDLLGKVLWEYVSEGDMSISQAVNVAVDIMFWNSNALYKLDEERKYPQLLRACGRSSGESMRTLVNHRSISGSIGRRVSDLDSVNSKSSTIVPSTYASRSSGQNSSGSVRHHKSISSVQPTRDVVGNQNLSLFEHFLENNPHVKYIWLQFLDYTGTLRNRMVPIKHFRKQLATGNNPGITMALPRLMQDDHGASGCIATGQFLLAPDMSSICLNKVIESPSATIQTWWTVESDEGSTEHYVSCPRWTLQRLVDTLKTRYNITMLMGFEVEIIFVRPEMTMDKADFTEFHALHNVHSWSNMTHQQLDMLPIVEEIIDTLAEVGIELEQFHSEAAPGQWEFPLPAYEPLKSIDILYKAREIIRYVARKHGLKATLYPRPYQTAPGSASHTHFSIHGLNDTVKKHADNFLAGVLEHLPSIMAFTLPLEESYERVKPGIWAGGEWVTWGTQNREVPLRKCGPGHWELKPVDGIGNMYLSMAALVAAGLHGLEARLPLLQQDTAMDPSSISVEERSALGITKLLPNSLEKSLAALEQDEVLRDLLGEKVVEDHLAVKRSEMDKLRGFGDTKRRIWLMSRY